MDHLSQPIKFKMLLAKVASNLIGCELRSNFWFLLLLAFAISVISAYKPMHIDDTFYYWVAQHIVSEPFDPYGFEIFWHQWPGMAYEGYVPPLMPYWLALSISIFGENPFLLKLSMLPFIILFVLATYTLGKRFSPTVAIPLTLFITLSPAILPSWNIMLDLPSIALSLCAVELFIRAIDRESWKYALAAGCVVAMATLTKFTALVVPGVMLLYSVLNRRLLLGVLSGACTLAIIIVWECLYFFQYGHTQLLWAIMQGSNSRGHGIGVFSIAALNILGATLPVLTAAFFPLRTFNSSYIVVVVIWLLIVFGGYSFGIYTGDFEILFMTLGIILFASIMVSVRFNIFSSFAKLDYADKSARLYLFLFGWLLLEATGSLLMSPFPAVRRLLLLSIVLSLLGFRVLAEKISVNSRRIGLLGCWILVLANMVISSIYVVVDYKDAAVQRTLASLAVEKIRQADTNGSIWYTSHWGFAFYAESEGMKPVIPERSVLKKNDWLVIPERVDRQDIKIDWKLLAQKKIIEAGDGIPLHTVVSFYADLIPLQKKEGRSRLRVFIFQVREDHLARSSWTLPQIIQYIKRNPDMDSTVNSLPALLSFRNSSNAQVRKIVVENAALLKGRAVAFAPTIAEMATDEDVSVRVSVLEALSEIGSHDPGITEVIKSRTHDPIAEVRRAARTALKELEGVNTQ